MSTAVPKRQKVSLTIPRLPEFGTKLTWNPVDWEAAIAEADRRYEIEQQRNRTPPRGSILEIQGDTGPERISISPVPLNYNKLRPPKTPSVTTQGSKLDYSSPSFPKSAKAKLKSILRRKETELTARNLRKVSKPEEYEELADSRVEGWLDNAEPVDDLQDRDDFINQKDSFPVWSQDREVSVGSGGDGPQMSSQTALRDVSNLRKPGYLERNSFFQDREKVPQPVTGSRPSPSRAADLERTLAMLEGRL